MPMPAAIINDLLVTRKCAQICLKFCQHTQVENGGGGMSASQKFQENVLGHPNLPSTTYHLQPTTYHLKPTT